MGLGQQASALFTAAVASVGAQAANPSLDSGPDLPTTAITSTYSPSADEMRELASTAVQGVDERIDHQFASIAADPPQQQPADSGAGALLRRREQRQRQDAKPEEKPSEVKPATEPQASQPATAKPATPEAAKPESAAGPAAPQATATQPAVQPAPKAEMWKQLTQEQIEKLNPEEMRTILIDLDKRTTEATRTLRLNQDQTAMYAQVSQILAEKKDAPAHEQIAAINSFFGQVYKDESEGLRQREAGVAEARKALAGELVNGVPRAIVDTVAGLNQARKDLKAGVEADRAAVDQGVKDTYALYTATNDQISAAKRALVVPTIDLGGLGGILGGPKEPTPEEVKKADEKRKADMAKEPMFKPLASIADPGADKDVQAAMKEITVEEALQYVSHGPAVLTPGEMRIRIAEQQANLAATELGLQGTDAALSEARKQAEGTVTGAPSKDNPVVQRVQALALTRQGLTDRTLKVEAAETGLQQPNMNDGQLRDLNAFAGIKNDEFMLGVTAKDGILQKNFGFINESQLELGKWSEAQWAEYRKWEALRQGRIGDVILGR